MAQFYSDVKDGCSPSALAQWINSRSAFVKSYFAMERGPETKAMQTGTEVHALIEAGIIKAKHVYEHNEGDVSIEIAPGRVFRGRPDSYGHDSVDLQLARFVDYKTGKANAWAEKLPTDIKMRATAWLVWSACGKPKTIEGSVEFFQTTWDPEQKKVVLIEGAESEIMKITYTGQEMQDFTQVILKAMDDVNAFYEKWLKSTGDFVSKKDIEQYVELQKEIDQKEAELQDIADRIATQMEFGGEENHKVKGLGSFYFRTTDKYEYPPTLPVKYTDMEIDLTTADGIAAAAKAAKQGFELMNEPTSSKRSLAFRAAKEK